jgi:two-component system, NtrC family, response regulator AtoC
MSDEGSARDRCRARRSGRHIEPVTWLTGARVAFPWRAMTSIRQGAADAGAPYSPPRARHRDLPARDDRDAGSDASRGFPTGLVLGGSAALRDAVELALKVAATRTTTVLLVGETGTGKELFARGVHLASHACREPFVGVNCAAIPESLLESELFGHEQGAFTDARSQKRGLLEMAGRGTLFLDEIGEMPASLQPKLLRVLEERRVRRLGGVTEQTVDCRIIAGTNVRLDDAVAEGTFRDDLFYRLNVFRIELPPLRERLEDVTVLAEHFLEQVAREQGHPPKRLSPEALTALREYHWPGNVRELKNVLERAAILAGGELIHARHVMLQSRTTASAEARAVPPVGAIQIPSDGKSLDEIEREAIQLTLLLTRGNLSAAARILGVSRPTLARKMRLSGLSRRTLLASS